jgi:hypothetical protein
MLNALRPIEYHYKGEAPGSPLHFGVFAQDLEKSRMGGSVVRDTPIGKVIDGREAIGPLFAAVAGLHNRVSQLEGRDLQADRPDPAKGAKGRK